MSGEEHTHPAVRVNASYENVRAECPWCRRESVFNRRSDLDDLSPIANKRVECLAMDCSKPFVIIGDSVNEAFEMLVFDTYMLVDLKHYMAAVLNLAQAHEVFFSTWLRVALAHRPYGADVSQGLGELNARLAELFEATRKLTFGKLRSLFLNLVTRPPTTTLATAQAVIADIPNLVTEPSNADLKAACDDADLQALLLRLKSSSIHELRNRVVHQHAYRAAREEVVDALEGTREILFGLAARLDVHDDPNWYARSPTA